MSLHSVMKKYIRKNTDLTRTCVHTKNPCTVSKTPFTVSKVTRVSYTVVVVIKYDIKFLLRMSLWESAIIFTLTSVSSSVDSINIFVNLACLISHILSLSFSNYNMALRRVVYLNNFYINTICLICLKPKVLRTEEMDA